MTLYEIDESILRLVDPDTGEITDVDRLEHLQLARDEKLENVALFIKNLDAEEQAYKNEKLVFAAKEAQAKRKKESLKKYLEYTLDGEKFKTTKVSVTYRRSEVIDIDKDAIIPDEYLRYVAPDVDKRGLKEAIKNGININGVKIIERRNMSIK